jgi:hypothetical protein
MVERIFSILQEHHYIRDVSRQGHKPAYPEMDDSMSQVFLSLLVYETFLTVLFEERPVGVVIG